VQDAADDQTPPVRITPASVAIDPALAWLTYRSTGPDSLTLGLSTMGIPVGRSPAWIAAGMLVAPTLLFLLVRARKVRLLFLLGASYVFTRIRDWQFLPLIWARRASTGCSARHLPRAHPALSQAMAGSTVIVNLGVLAIFALQLRDRHGSQRPVQPVSRFRS
jgi:hypothetical protein